MAKPTEPKRKPKPGLQPDGGYILDDSTLDPPTEAEAQTLADQASDAADALAALGPDMHIAIARALETLDADDRTDTAEWILRALDPQELANVIHWTLGSRCADDSGTTLQAVAMTAVKALLGLPLSEDEKAKAARYSAVVKGRRIRGDKETAHTFRFLAERAKDFMGWEHDTGDWRFAAAYLLPERPGEAIARKPDVSPEEVEAAFTRKTMTGVVTDLAFALGLVEGDVSDKSLRGDIQRAVRLALKKSEGKP